jgi:translocation and assembly module TamA
MLNEDTRKSVVANLFRVAMAALCLFPFPCPAQEEQEVAYSVAFLGVPAPELLELLQSVSDIYTYREQALPSIRLIENRAANDIPQLLEALASWGYFKADVAVDVRPGSDDTRVVFEIFPGPRFLLEEVSILDEQGAPSQELPTAGDIMLLPGEAFRAQFVLDARGRLLRVLGNSGHPYPKILDTDVVADHATNTVRVRFRVSPGPMAWFGETQIEGLSRVKEDHTARLLPWEEGELFRQELIEQARLDLIRSGLFTMVDFRTGEIRPDFNRLPMLLRLRERNHRTLRVGLNYTTDFGFGGLLGWEHRNLFGRGEHLETLFAINELRQSFDTTFLKPFFLREDQRLVLRSTLAREDSDAFTSQSYRNTANIERDLGRRVTAGVGVGIDYLDVEDVFRRDSFVLLYFPLFLTVNTSDDLLDPTRGFTLGTQVTPFVELTGENLQYVRYEFNGSVYYEVLDGRRLIVASRGRYGQIIGEDRVNVPATERFYAGGGGSVRGYPYQSLAPLGPFNEPVGGRSVVELSVELRTRFTERLGAAVFLDGGRSYEEETPDFGQSLFWGAGVGFRYYTVIGPIRLDLAFPLRNRESVDDSFQIYISIGQAF